MLPTCYPTCSCSWCSFALRVVCIQGRLNLTICGNNTSRWQPGDYVSSSIQCGCDKRKMKKLHLRNLLMLIFLKKNIGKTYIYNLKLDIWIAMKSGTLCEWIQWNTVKNTERILSTRDEKKKRLIFYYFKTKIENKLQLEGDRLPTTGDSISAVLESTLVWKPWHKSNLFLSWVLSTPTGKHFGWDNITKWTLIHSENPEHVRLLILIDACCDTCL